jgi:hypothetical protein
VADFDGDGWPDIYFVNGRDLYNRGISVRNALIERVSINLALSFTLLAWHLQP